LPDCFSASDRRLKFYSKRTENDEEQIYFTSEFVKLWNSLLGEWKYCSRFKCVL